MRLPLPLALSILALSILAACSRPGPAVVDPPADTTTPRWELTFSDDFAGDTLDRAKWFIKEHWPFANNELGYYRFANTRVADGVLRIRSDRERTPGPWGWHDYTTGWAQTIHSQAFGRWEVRARMPAGRGIHSGHWLQMADSTWPPEIDIVEVLGSTPTWAWFHNHWRDSASGDPRNHGGPWIGPDFTRDFHTFAIEWEPTIIRWYVDGIWRFSSTRQIPQRPMYLTLSTTVGGDWAGPPDSTTTLPVHQEIDWVRIYRRVE